ncbi:hypothetical protein CLU79DRAFT_772120 [Phycomyces nitens]|nr:hypothetical protein CLU79DRAFT_772120 [Phycomyces nitens]
MVRFQQDFIQTTQEVAMVAYKLLDSNLFLEYSTTILSHLLHAYALVSSDQDELYFSYSLLFYAGKEDVRWMKYIISEARINKQNQLFRKMMSELENPMSGSKMIGVLLSLTFEMSKVTKLRHQDREMITPSLLNYMFDIVESTRGDDEESFNYQVIRLILVFNEQFMMSQKNANENLVLKVLSKRMGTTNTFSENLFFMLNRSSDGCVQLLILKLLYGVFTEPCLHEYFYTNDLFVLVDIILRKVCDLGEDREAETLRDAYLRVLRPLLVNTQLRETPYKRAEIHRLLCSMITPAMHRPVDPATKSVVKKILEEWWEQVCEQPVAPVLGVHVNNAVIENCANKAIMCPQRMSSESSTTDSIDEKGVGLESGEKTQEIVCGGA